MDKIDERASDTADKLVSYAGAEGWLFGLLFKLSLAIFALDFTQIVDGLDEIGDCLFELDLLLRRVGGFRLYDCVPLEPDAVAVRERVEADVRVGLSVLPL